MKMRFASGLFGRAVIRIFCRDHILKISTTDGRPMGTVARGVEADDREISCVTIMPAAYDGLRVRPSEDRGWRLPTHDRVVDMFSPAQGQGSGATGHGPG